jgi:hypothetical protein
MSESCNCTACSERNLAELTDAVIAEGPRAVHTMLLIIGDLLTTMDASVEGRRARSAPQGRESL